nr:hypothetical protein [Candidatus Cloacimonadota bacterium]
MVPPHPAYGDIPSDWYPIRPEMKIQPESKSGTSSTFRDDFPGQITDPLPSNVLVVMVEFSDVHFNTEPQYPDYLVHDQAYFERWMLHLSDFFYDASHSHYELQYTVYPEVFQMSRPISWYGGDISGKTDAQLMDILPDLMEQSSAQINYSDFDGLIIFHAGAGQETDVERQNTNSIWSTFLTRRAMQTYFDPDNDDYPGYITPDSAILTNVVIVPEHEYHPYFPAEGDEYASNYLFSIYGVLAHQFGHVLGLPTLFDNDSSDGVSQGIGNWGLMGTGVWNANGYVPAQLSAWSRYFLAWEDVETITTDGEDFVLDHFLNHQDNATRLYKVPISEQEYFLIENRQQNPDGSLDPYSNLPSYSFKLLPEGEQDYYEDFPELPYFNFTENRYVGSEWDFFLPGFGMNPYTDGSGILIWHIDENVIADNFTLNFDSNRVNANASHKGVDLEEADGFQHLDTALQDYNKFGGPDDSYRANNNDYFGDDTHDGLIWLPTSESYYGGIPLEIYNISASGNQMTFSVRFAWHCDAGYNDINTIPAAKIDLDPLIQSEIFYPMPDGKIALFHDEIMAEGFPIQTLPIPELYVYDSQALYIPMQNDDGMYLYKISQDERTFILNIPNYEWLSHPVDAGNSLILPLWDQSSGKTRLLAFDKNSHETNELFASSETLRGNLSLSPDRLRGILQYEESGAYSLFEYTMDSENLTSYPLSLPADSLVTGVYAAHLAETDNLIVQSPYSVWVYDLNAEGATLRQGFPFALDFQSSAPLTLADIDQNGKLEIFVASSTGIKVIDHRGSDISLGNLDLGLQDDGISAGVLVCDLDGDAKLEMIGNFNLNRLAAWGIDYRLKRNFPISLGERSRHMPFVAEGLDGNYYLWSATDKGRIYRTQLSNYVPGGLQSLWQHEFGNLSRTAWHPGSEMQNQYLSSGKFVTEELYFFPNPLKRFYKPKITLSVMPTQDMQVSLKIFDTSGKLIYEHRDLAFAYLRNMNLFEIPVDKLSNGMYIAVVSGGGETHRLHFGIEK